MEERKVTVKKGEEKRFKVFEKIKCFERYLELREMKLPESGEIYIMLNYKHCILHLK